NGRPMGRSLRPARTWRERTRTDCNCWPTPDGPAARVTAAPRRLRSPRAGTLSRRSSTPRRDTSSNLPSQVDKSCFARVVTRPARHPDSRGTEQLVDRLGTGIHDADRATARRADLSLVIDAQELAERAHEIDDGNRSFDDAAAGGIG